MRLVAGPSVAGRIHGAVHLDEVAHRPFDSLRDEIHALADRE
jgi:hypothetical protein